MTFVVDLERAETTHTVYSTVDRVVEAAAASIGIDSTPSAYQFVDYRSASTQDDQKTQTPPLFIEIVKGLTAREPLPGTTAPGFFTLPTVLLYDDRGLELFDRITYVPEYYLTASEIDILETRIQEIVAEIPDDSDVIELGCGSLRKTKILLDALNRQRTGITYYAIDVMPQPLHDSMGGLSTQLENISLVALCGTYEEVMSHFGKSTRRKTVLWLGSSIGGCTADYATGLLSSVTRRVLNENDAVIVGMDLQKDSAVIMDAYHDSQGVTAEFELNIASHVNSIVSCLAEGQHDDFLDIKKLKYVGEYDEGFGRHDSYLEAQEDMVVQWPQSIRSRVAEICGNADDLVFKNGDRIYIESSYKYGPGAAESLANATELTLATEWVDSRNYYSLNLFRKPKFFMRSAQTANLTTIGKWCGPAARARSVLQELPSTRTSAPDTFCTIPDEKEWRQMWSAWDTLTLEIVPREKLHDKPIDLRHPFIFYLGHMPAFADIHMTAADSEPPTEPSVYTQWFERGIDPNIKNKTVTHSHSEIPDEWPAVADILAYRDRVHARILRWLERYKNSNGAVSADSARHVWMAFEHHAMHIETFFYMILQMAPLDIQPPIRVSFGALDSARTPDEQWLHYAGGKDIVFGLANDNEQDLKKRTLPPGHVFGWDNEGPQIRADIESFSIQTRSITNQEYLEFLCALSSHDDYDELVPCSWVALDTTSSSSTRLASDYGVRTVVGAPSITRTEAALWPVFVSHKQAESYANWRGKRLPTESEWTHASRTFHLAAALNREKAQLFSGKHSGGQATGSNSAWPELQPVDTYVAELLAEQNTTLEEQVMQQPFDMYIPSDANIGFAHWHPVPVSTSKVRHDNGSALPDASFVGNGWEWTATMFQPYNGFEASPMYPGYSADFFDPEDMPNAETAHYVVKGGSYVTHSRIAQRQTFRNWYQRGYPYVLATFRLCESNSTSC
ncbi:hypothetical protein H4217_002191 [Coemansia sp. RSA 1939]|nr:hypothetical protein H4217_002191 [Coemansia sp. RSA 1939]KAJ2614680.1 hypothetical protein EV177_001940 [Coemansia sp. RSA 1804]KAJ2692128.1 hypothetical protein GGH99_001932 [Coemansia sp. RSA 1285]